ncbi:MAG: S8 family serine peptidase, partial [Acidobacteriota bacterium]
ALVGLNLGNSGHFSLLRHVSAQSQYEEVLRRQQVAARQLRRSATAESRFEGLSARIVERGVVPVIVTLRVAFSAQSEIREGIESQAQRARIASVRENLIDNLHGYDPNSVKRYDWLPVLAVRVNASGLEALRQSHEVLDIQEDKLNRPTLARSGPFIGAPAAWASSDTGSGQMVAVLDTGVDKTHPMITGRVVTEACYSTNSSGNSSGSFTTSLCPGRAPSSTEVNSALLCPSGCEHGTHGAGIGAGNAVSYGGQTFSGVAKDARIVAIQVYSEVYSVDECGEGKSPCYRSFDSDILKGLQRVLELRPTYPIAAVNMSLDAGRYFANCDETNAAMKQVIDLLRAANITTIVASGNGGDKDSMSSPACISTAVSAGATRDAAKGTASFSNSDAAGQEIESVQAAAITSRIGVVPPVSVAATAQAKLQINPRFQWGANYGYCGEVSFISAGLYYGQYLSQYDARSLANGTGKQNRASSQLLLGVNDSAAADRMHLAMTKWSGVGVSAFLSWVKKNVLAGAPVVIAVFTNSWIFDGDARPTAGDSEYDHIVPVHSITTNHGLTDASYYDDDTLTFSDNGLYGDDTPTGSPYHFTYAFGLFPRTRAQANLKTGPVYSLPLNTANYGVAFTGVKDAYRETLPVRITTSTNAELPSIANGSNTRPAAQAVTLTVTVSGLVPGKAYKLYRYNSMAAVPDGSFNANAAKASSVWPITITSGSTYVLTQSIMSNQSVAYRAVPATAR